MAELPFSVRQFTTDTTAKIVVISASATEPSLTGLTGTWGSVTGVGDDGAGGVTDSGGGGAGVDYALYHCIFTATGLSPDTSYSVTVTQGSSRAITVTTQAASTTADDFTVFVVSCDANTNADNSTDKGCYGYIRSVAESGNVKGIIHVDDHGYPDSLVTDNPSSPLWNAVSANTTTRAYAYAVSYAAYTGLIDTYTRFHDEDRIWCHSNLPMFVSVGDHEATNNPEEGTTFTDARKADAREAWLGTIGAVMPYTDSDVSFAWVAHIGPIELIAYDRFSGLTTGPAAGLITFDESQQLAARNSAYLPAPVDTRWLGTAQIDDITNAELDATSPFKMLVMSAGGRAMMSTADRLSLIAGGQWTNTAWLGAQQPMHEYTAVSDTDSEWLELMTDKTQVGIAQKAATYGAVVFGVHGDTHHTGTRYEYRPEDASNAQLSMYQFSCGSVNGRNAHALYGDSDKIAGIESIEEGSSYKNTHMTYIPSWVPRTPAGGAGKSTCLQIDGSKVNGSWQLTVKSVEVDPSNNSATIASSVTLKHGTAANHPKHLRSGFI